ncbi:MAG: VCBS domain-containing protein, partial [Burkholderiales bacterium]
MLTVVNAGTYGRLDLESDGAFAYTLDNASAAVQSLAAGQVVVDEFEYLATDGIASTPGMLTITVRGTNDAPVATDDAARVVEDTVLFALGNVLDNDADVDQGTTLSAISLSTLAGIYGTLAVDVDGGYLYTLNDSVEVQSLAQGQETFDVFGYAANDGIASATAVLSVGITGANDAPVVVNPIEDQSAVAGSPFSFTVPENTFFDIDTGDVLGYTATIVDGTLLPTWLTFNRATRTFIGTPPDHCGAESLEIRVTTTDPWRASAFDDFTLAIAGGSGGGQDIVGTDGEDVLTGTPCDDVIDGGLGFDIMLGGNGDDIYFVDQTCADDDDHDHRGNEGVGNGEDPPPPGHDVNQNDGPGTSPGFPGSKGSSSASLYSQLDGSDSDDRNGDRDDNEHDGDDDDDDDHDNHEDCVVDQVVENANEGYDIIFASGDFSLPANVEELRLLGNEDLKGTGNALDNVLVGNRGDNRLKGALGADTYVYGLGGGDDVIEESGSEKDTLQFGEGITTGMVNLYRRGDDLVADLSGQDGSVTVKSWFALEGSQVERIEFADGTVWGV